MYGRAVSVTTSKLAVTASKVALELAEPLEIAGRTIVDWDVVHVRIEYRGVVGFGEASPFARYGESVSSALAYVERAAAVLGDDPWSFDEIAGRLPPDESAARSGIDAALLDLCGKLVSRPVWQLLGLRRSGPATSWTIGILDPDETARIAERSGGRFRQLKLKLGGGDGLDVERVRATRSVVDLPLRVDVNEGWMLDEALDVLPQLQRLDVELCEQPLPAGSEDGARLKRRSPIPIYVDEDCRAFADLPHCAGISHGVNIKLAKSGGIREAIRMIHAARELGLGIMLGCMAESGLGISAAAQIASLCDHADLDGNLHLRRDPWPCVELVDGVQLPSEAPGLGAPTNESRQSPVLKEADHALHA